MAYEGSLDEILDFLRINKFIQAEAALRTELSNRPDLNGFLKSHTQDENGPVKVIHQENTDNYGEKSALDHRNGSGTFTELVIREIDCGPEKEWKNLPVREFKRPNDTDGESFTFSKGFDETLLDRVSWKTNCNNDGPYDMASSSNNFPEVTMYEHHLYSLTDVCEGHKINRKSGEGIAVLGERRMDQVNIETNVDKIRDSEYKDVKDHSFKTALPFSLAEVSTSYKRFDKAYERKDCNNKEEKIDVMTAFKEQVDEVGRALYMGKLKENIDFENSQASVFVPFSDTRKEDLPRLPPVKLKTEDKLLTVHWEEKYDQDGIGNDLSCLENNFLIGSYLNVPIGQDVNSAGGKQGGGSWLSVSQGIAEDNSDLISGFATIGDELNESIGYPNEYWDSDEYDDDDDVGYMRQPIEDEAWFMAHEVDYPSDSEKRIRHGSGPNPPEIGLTIDNEEDDDADNSQSSLSSGQYDGQLIGEELNFLCGEPVWHGLDTESNELITLVEGKVPANLHGRPMIDDFCVEDGQRGSVRSIGVGITADAPQIVCKNQHPNTLKSNDIGDDLIKWKRRSNDPLNNKGLKGEDLAVTERSVDSSPSLASFEFPDRELTEREADEVDNDGKEIPSELVEDDEAAAVQEQVRQIKTQEEEFETFDLKIIHRKNRTGFEEDKNFHAVLNSVIAGRYHVTEYLGSAAFSKAVQAHDLQTGMDVCVKIIKNNKDFFDQSLDEIKLLKYINKHDPTDQFHILRLYDYFYYREHLMIVCELLKANLYEFHKFNRESGGEVYFTMPRLQSITIQCLEALQFLHGLGLIHCDLKPENILVKSYSRCEIKVIDLGSSCFETDHLCSYVQSRSYRAPEVILGLPYNQKIDIWSLGCVLSELCTGNVLFQNDSLATLLARVIGIIGPIDQAMLARGKDSHKYFTKNHMLYERNQEINRLEYLIPKRSSLRHRIPMGDQGFVDFVSHLLEVNPEKRPTASEALKHPWLSFPYEPISS
ncbi:hypothetical protein SAY87_007481 [Trapa incisa]|uniref:Protein kinase domain-containing protein n=1 Tax=Trapa incisa TaxID=236973 RepID=A0AAN7KIN7_9MYRT|nr:hypothetical protein SAY87_007481 [Trapa incisa]